MQKSVVTGVLGFVSGLLVGTLFKTRREDFEEFFSIEDEAEGDDDNAPAYTKQSADDSESTLTPSKHISVIFDFDLVADVYEKFGKDGVYAYLRDNNLAKDYQHGCFIIEKIFIPEYEQHKRRHPDAPVIVVEPKEPPQS